MGCAKKCGCNFVKISSTASDNQWQSFRVFSKRINPHSYEISQVVPRNNFQKFFCTFVFLENRLSNSSVSLTNILRNETSLKNALALESTHFLQDIIVYKFLTHNSVWNGPM